MEIPEAMYAVFTTQPVDFTEDSSLFTNAINGTWKYIVPTMVPVTKVSSH
jgi:hypothetical protein